MPARHHLWSARIRGVPAYACADEQGYEDHCGRYEIASTRPGMSSDSIGMRKQRVARPIITALSSLCLAKSVARNCSILRRGRYAPARSAYNAKTPRAMPDARGHLLRSRRGVYAAPPHIIPTPAAPDDPTTTTHIPSSRDRMLSIPANTWDSMNFVTSTMNALSYKIGNPGIPARFI